MRAIKVEPPGKFEHVLVVGSDRVRNERRVLSGGKAAANAAGSSFQRDST